MNVAIIPARGGSKRIPRKNIKLFHGKPIIAYSIEAAITSGCFDKIIVSTDDDEIADIARQYGAQVPFIRPAHLADDHSTTLAVISHALNWMIDNEEKPDLTCIIYATAPFLRPETILQSFRLLKEHSDKKFCFGVTEYPSPIQRALKISPSGEIEMFQEEFLNSRSQDLETAYHDVGQFYWGRTDAFLDGSEVFTKLSIPYIIPGHHVLDIDTPDDWLRAEILYRINLELSDKT